MEELRLGLLKLIQNEDWEGLRSELEASLKNGNTASELVASALLQVTSQSKQQQPPPNEIVGGRNALHVICSLHPPVSIIRTIRQICPSCLEGIDDNGYTPLHVAAECGASPQVIDCLLYWYPEASALKEYRGKTPLHLLLCTPNCCSKDGSSHDPSNLVPKQCTAATTPVLQILQSLIKAAPQSVNEEDDEGLNPLECAINSGASMSVIRALQRASVTAWTEMDKNKANQEYLKKRLQVAIIQVELPSRRKLSITNDRENTTTTTTTTTNSRAQMVMDLLSSSTANKNNNSNNMKRTKHDRRINWIETGLTSDTPLMKRLPWNRERVKPNVSRAA